MSNHHNIVAKQHHVHHISKSKQSSRKENNPLIYLLFITGIFPAIPRNIHVTKAFVLTSAHSGAI